MTIETWRSKYVDIRITLPTKEDIENNANIYVEYDVYMEGIRSWMPSTTAYFEHPIGDDGSGLDELRLLLTALRMEVVINTDK